VVDVTWEFSQATVGIEDQVWHISLNISGSTLVEPSGVLSTISLCVERRHIMRLHRHRNS
jgi:hypothetical protein